MTTGSGKTPLVTLHLSDIHFGQERGEDVYINKDARNQLVRAVAQIAQERAARGRAKIGSIIITGDIAYSGQQKQFEDAVEWLTQVSDAAGSDRLSVQVVPGNHDVDRGTSPMVTDMLRQLFRLGKSRLEEVLGSEPDRAALYGRLKAYESFSSGYGCPLDQNGGHAGEKQHELAPGYTLRIVGLNTALLCCGLEKPKPPKLMLGARQRIIPDEDDVEFIVLMHHPLTWLRDGEQTQNYIDNRARILMCGHEHQPAVQERTVPGNGKVLVIDAGATVPDKITDEYTYTFNIVEIDITDERDAVDVMVDTYKWKESATRFEQDRSGHVDDKLRVYRLPCPKFAALAASKQTPSSPPALPEAQSEDIVEDQIEAIEVTFSPSGAGGDAHRFASARSAFFHKLGTAERIAVLVKLQAIPENVETLSSNLMLRQLDRIHRKGQAEELISAISEAIEGKK